MRTQLQNPHGGAIDLVPIRKSHPVRPSDSCWSERFELRRDPWNFSAPAPYGPTGDGHMAGHACPSQTSRNQRRMSPRHLIAGVARGQALSRHLDAIARTVSHDFGSRPTCRTHTAPCCTVDRRAAPAFQIKMIESTTGASLILLCQYTASATDTGAAAESQQPMVISASGSANGGGGAEGGDDNSSGGRTEVSTVFRVVGRQHAPLMRACVSDPRVASARARQALWMGEHAAAAGRTHTRTRSTPPPHRQPRQQMDAPFPPPSSQSVTNATIHAPAVRGGAAAAAAVLDVVPPGVPSAVHCVCHAGGATLASTDATAAAALSVSTMRAHLRSELGPRPGTSRVCMHPSLFSLVIPAAAAVISGCHQLLRERRCVCHCACHYVNTSSRSRGLYLTGWYVYVRQLTAAWGGRLWETDTTTFMVASNREVASQIFRAAHDS
jgi:hypothetical protein